MEDVLDLYQQPYDPDYPVICMDEKPYQLLGETRPPIPMKKGQPKRINDEYIRNGTCCIFLFTEALAGWRHAGPREHRTKVDWAHQIRHLLEIEYPNCFKIRLVMDNLNTHTISSLYKAFAPDIALTIYSFVYFANNLVSFCKFHFNFPDSKRNLPVFFQSPSFPDLNSSLLFFRLHETSLPCLL